MAILPFDVQNALKRQAPKALRRSFEKEARRRFKEIKAEMIKDAPADKLKAILPYIQKPLIYLAAAELMNETGGFLDSKGLIFNKTAATFPGNKVTNPGTPETVMKRVNLNKLKASQYIEALKAYLIANIASWEEYSGQTGSLFSRDNTDKKSFWA